jgi:hypothetical protein
MLYSFTRRVVALSMVRPFARLTAVDVLHVTLSAQKTLARTPRSFVVRTATVADVTALGEYYAAPRLVQDRIQRGDLCAMTLCQDRIGAAVWIAIGPNEYREDWEDLRCSFRCPAGTGFTYDGKGTKLGAWGTMMVRLPELLRGTGITELYTAIDCNNWHSSDTHRSLGYAHVGLLATVRLCGLTVRICRPRGQRWHRPPTRIGALEVA